MITAAFEAERRRVVRNGMVMGATTGAYALTFGALGVASGLSVLQTCLLSLVMFTGGSQFAFVGVVGGGGSPLAGAATAILLGARNTLYGLTMAPLLKVRGLRKLLTSQLVIDESTAMAIGEDDDRLKRAAFWATGLGIYVFWNSCTLIGALVAGALPDPRTLGLDAVAPAAFVFLFAPRLKSRQAWMAAFIGVAVSIAVVPLVSAGLPVIVAAVATGAYALISRGEESEGPDPTTDPDPMTEGEPHHDEHGAVRAGGDRAHDRHVVRDHGRGATGPVDVASTSDGASVVEIAAPGDDPAGDAGPNSDARGDGDARAASADGGDR